MNARRLAALAVVGVLALAGCTGVPSSSSPEVVTSLNAEPPSGPNVSAPPLNTDPRNVVLQFLSLSADADSRSAVALTYLTHDADTRWESSSATVLDSLTVSNFVALTSTTGAVTVRGRRIGSLDASGTYQPDLQGDGSGGAAFQTTFGMKYVDNVGWRINALDKGVLLDADEFDRSYQQHSIYFFDSSEQHLVADPRYTSHADPAQLASWLIAQVANGPRPELQSSTVTEVPAKTAPATVTVTLGNPAQIAVIGASQLDPVSRTRLAAQLATTLQPAYDGPIEIIDGGKATPIPNTGTLFNAALYGDLLSRPSSVSPLYYIVDGHIQVVNGDAIPAGAQRGYGLSSVAIARTTVPDLRVAATTGQGSTQQLLIGTVNTGLRPTTVHGALSRPAWAPHLDEVWIGSGSTLYRVGLSGRVSTVAMLAANGTVIAGRVGAVRFSPDGTRIAMVLTVGSTSQIWIGAVSRQAAAGQVHVDSLEQISPQLVSVTDVAWNDQLRLFAVGRSTTSGVASVYEVQVDGSRWTARGISNLPQAPDSITVTENEVAWVSASNTVWELQAGTWTSPNGTGETRGTNPVYLE